MSRAQENPEQSDAINCIFLASRTARDSLNRWKSHSQGGHLMISQKEKARQEAEKAHRQAMLKACGYIGPEEQAPEVAAARASRPEGEAGDADLRPHRLLVPGGRNPGPAGRGAVRPRWRHDLPEEADGRPVMPHAVDWLLQIRLFGGGPLCAADATKPAIEPRSREGNPSPR